MPYGPAKSAHSFGRRGGPSIVPAPAISAAQRVDVFGVDRERDLGAALKRARRAAALQGDRERRSLARHDAQVNVLAQIGEIVDLSLDPVGVLVGRRIESDTLGPNEHEQPFADRLL